MQEEYGLFGIKADKLTRKVDILAGFDLWHRDCNISGENVYNASRKAYKTPTAPHNARLFNLGSGNRPANLGDLIMTPAMYRRNSWFPTVFDEFLNSDLMNTVSTTAPSVNVKETEKAYIVELAAPGVKKEYCRVHIDEDHNLCVAIENKFEHKEEDKHSHYLRREFSYTNYEQKYSLPDDVNEEEINAKVEDGILTIELPKLEKVVGKTTKQIEIK